MRHLKNPHIQWRLNTVPLSVKKKRPYLLLTSEMKLWKPMKKSQNMQFLLQAAVVQKEYSLYESLRDNDSLFATDLLPQKAVFSVFMRSSSMQHDVYFANYGPVLKFFPGRGYSDQLFSHPTKSRGLLRGFYLLNGCLSSPLLSGLLSHCKLKKLI